VLKLINKRTKHEYVCLFQLPQIGMKVDAVLPFIKNSLTNLKLDYVDLYLIHWPIGMDSGKDYKNFLPRTPSGEFSFDFETDLEHIWKSLETLVDDGLVKALGLSNFNILQIERILKISRHPPSNLQVSY